MTDASVDLPSADMEVHSTLELMDELYDYNHWIFNKIRPFIKGAVCEIGCGIGVVTQFLLAQKRVVGVEPYEQSLRHARRRFADHLNVSFAACRLQHCPNDEVPAKNFDTVVCLNVLEHIEEDVEALRHMRMLCGDGGQTVVLVPAHMSAYGHMDRWYGHVRRYSRRTLGKAFTAAGMRVVHSFYMNAIGYLGWLVEGRVLRRQRIPASAARMFNRLVPFIDALERLIEPPFGQSLVMVGTPAHP